MKVAKIAFFHFFAKVDFRFFFFRRSATSEVRVQMEFSLSGIMVAMYSPNPITGTSQLFHFAAVEMTEPRIGAKNGDFLPIF